MKGWVFFPLAAAAFAAVTTVALRPWAERPGAAVEARAGPGGLLVLEGAALGQLAPTAGFPVTAAPGIDGTQLGPRTVADRPLETGPDGVIAAGTAGGPDPGAGARLLLGPQTRARLAGQPLTVELQTAPLPHNASTALAVALVVAGQPVRWVRAPVPQASGAVRLTLPPAGGPPLALAVWPSVSGGGRGVEIRSIRIGGAR